MIYGSIPNLLLRHYPFIVFICLKLFPGLFLFALTATPLPFRIQLQQLYPPAPLSDLDSISARAQADHVI